MPRVVESHSVTTLESIFARAATDIDASRSLPRAEAERQSLAALNRFLDEMAFVAPAAEHETWCAAYRDPTAVCGCGSK